MKLNYEVIRQEIEARWGQGSITADPRFYSKDNAMVCLLGAAGFAGRVTEDQWLKDKEENGSSYDTCYNGDVAVTFAADVAPVIKEMFPGRVPARVINFLQNGGEEDPNVGIVWRFNDDAETTKEDVLAVIDEVIRRKGQQTFEIPQQLKALDSLVAV